MKQGAAACDLYIGTYTQPIRFGTGEIMQGRGCGIARLRMECTTGAIQDRGAPANVVNPSFLTADKAGRFLYAVNELKEYKGQPGGSASAFAIEKDGLKQLSTEASVGSDPCFITTSPDRKCAVVSNFMTGSVTVFPIDAEGRLLPHHQFFQHEGRSVHPVRQQGPHAHSAVFDRAGRYVLVPDLGLDKIMLYRYQDGGITPAGAYCTAPGSGPRYGEFHPTLDLFYVINELGSSISALEYDPENGQLQHRETHSTLTGTPVKDNICADLHISPDGKWLYGSNRGADTLVVFHLDEQGRMELVQSISSGGRTPRNFALVDEGRFLVAANQDSDNLAIFRMDAGNGMLTQIASYPIKTPVCVLPLTAD